MIDELKEKQTESFYERMVFAHFVEAAIDRFPPEFLKEHLFKDFLSYSNDSVISIKLLFLEVVPRMRDLAICDRELLGEVQESVSVLWEDPNPKVRSMAEKISLELLMWKKESPATEEMKEEFARR